MELRNYWVIVRRRLWIIGLLVLAVGVVSSIMELRPASRTADEYKSTTTIFIGVTPQGPNPKYVYPDTFDYYYANVASEYLADDFTVAGIMNSENFAREIISAVKDPTTTAALAQKFGPSANLGSGITDPILVSKAIDPSRSHRIIKATVSWPTKAGAWAIAYGIDEVMQKDIVKFLGFAFSADQQRSPNTLPVHIQVEDVATDPVATTAAATSTTRHLTNLVLRVALALVAGVALAFLLEYLDDTIRTAEDVARYLDLPVQGSIPVPVVARRSRERSRKKWIAGSS